MKRTTWESDAELLKCAEIETKASRGMELGWQETPSPADQGQHDKYIIIIYYIMLCKNRTNATWSLCDKVL